MNKKSKGIKKNTSEELKSNSIDIYGAEQNNLKNLYLKLPIGKLIVVTGVSGSGKSSLVFDTITAEGQRRYIETFSSYARQFIDRMDKPRVEKILGVPPTVSIEQTNPIKNSRSTVGTITELSDHFKLLFARCSKLYCYKCNNLVKEMPANRVAKEIIRKFSQKKIGVTFSLKVPESISDEELVDSLSAHGYTRILKRSKTKTIVITDRFTVDKYIEESRLIDSIENAYKAGKFSCEVYDLKEMKKLDSYSKEFHCASCEITFKRPRPALFSFNSPIGACEECKGFGRVIGVDSDLVVPDINKSISEGAIRPFQSKSYFNCQKELLLHAKKNKINVNLPWKKLSKKDKDWIFDGSNEWSGKWTREWYGVKRFFKKLEKKSYKMHVRVFLSRYRSYSQCKSCSGTRLKSESLHWLILNKNIHQWLSQPIEVIDRWIEELQQELLNKKDYINIRKAIEVVLEEIQSRLIFCKQVGLGYLTLDRQSRTLSGGEVQRINLTTALGTSLVNTLFVLDEPSIGLHSKDIENLMHIILRLKNAGNTILIVEHDPQVISAADHIIELGPGPGLSGGKICFEGPYMDLLESKCLTGKYLRNEKKLGVNSNKSHLKNKLFNQTLKISGAKANNIKEIDVKIPLECICCITGVSGSGKSTLIQNILYPALCNKLGISHQSQKTYKKIEGYQSFHNVENIDQSSIGKTSRSNPVVYIGAFNDVRKVFSSTQEAKKRGYSPGHFSFNAGNGRCPECLGHGYEKVEMQFLSDVFLSCEKCNGKRYRSEILEIKFKNNSISDILEMTISEACVFFEDITSIYKKLSTLSTVGLGYLKLGQSLSTLSGGESQRLKIASHLSSSQSNCRGQDLKNKPTQPTLFLFDEPTTGLHLDDINTLLEAMKSLVARGHSLIIIEHSLEFIYNADWIIDMGPEAGSKGGNIIAEGTPNQIKDIPLSYTGRALAKFFPLKNQISKVNLKRIPNDNLDNYQKNIEVINAHEHNLKNLSVKIPHNELTVITGVSGSGKSSLAFDILFSEGQRRYLESLNAYARQFIQPGSRPKVDSITGISPTVAIEQRSSRGGNKSTVGTLTEIHHYLRLLFVKIGKQFCPKCKVPISPMSKESIHSKLITDFNFSKIIILSTLISGRKGNYKELALWAIQKKYSKLRVDGRIVLSKNFPKLDRYKEHTIELVIEELTINKENEVKLFTAIEDALELGKGSMAVLTKAKKKKNINSSDVRLDFDLSYFSTLNSCTKCETGFLDLDPRLFSYNSKIGWCKTCIGSGLKIIENVENTLFAENADEESNNYETESCQMCKGGRLNEIAQSVYVDKKTIVDLSKFSVTELKIWCSEFLKSVSEREIIITRDLISEIESRLNFLNEVGLGYITLERSAPTLSGGEAQRIRLASQLGSNLKGVCYILDEPTIGLHPKDNKALLKILRSLQKKGNTVVVVEHDEETISIADNIIDIGPDAGINGGNVVAAGKLKDILKSEKSITAKFLKKPIIYQQRKNKINSNSFIEIYGANANNLQNLNIKIPLNKLTVITGVSGSGKSTLAKNILIKNLKDLNSRKKYASNSLPRNINWSGCEKIENWDKVSRVLEVDQTPIGKTSRSTPATYIGFWDKIRRVFAQCNEAKMRGWSHSHFSFNSGEGRCPTCKGNGVQKIEMNFLPNVLIDCEECFGSRFTFETTKVLWKKKSISDILNMSVEIAADFFEAHHQISKSLNLLKDLGLGYLTLGQSSPTLSGGEAQRIKLVSELCKSNNYIHTLYVLDEPTVGLHMADVEKLIKALNKLVDSGNTVVVVEHQLDIWACSDWIIDLGPTGGERGGKLMNQAPPEIIKKKKTSTGIELNKFLETNQTKKLGI